MDLDHLLAHMDDEPNDEGRDAVDAAPRNEEADRAMWIAAEAIARVNATASEREEALEQLKGAVGAGGRADLPGQGGFRVIDLIAKGHDGPHAAAALEFMAEAGFAEAMMCAPGPIGMPPMMAACHEGSPVIVERLLELGMPADVKANAPAIKVLGGTPFHATVAGFREAREDDFAAVLRLLLTYCPDGINIPDRTRQKPIDMAAKAAAVTGNKSLIEAMLHFGVETVGSGAAGADKIIPEIARRGGAAAEGYTRALIARNEAARVIHELGATGAPKP